MKAFVSSKMQRKKTSTMSSERDIRRMKVTQTGIQIHTAAGKAIDKYADLTGRWARESINKKTEEPLG